MRKLQELLPTSILILATLSIRIWNLNLHALSGDEAFTIITWTPASLYELLHTVGTIDPQPPIALVSTVFWLNQAGTSEFAARLYSVLSSLIFVAAVYAIAKHLFHTQIGLLAALCASLNPYQLWLSQDIRPYAPWMAASALSTLTLLHLIKQRPNQTRSYIYHAVASILALGMFYFEVFNIIAHNLIALVWLPKSRSNLLRWSAVQLLLIAALYLFLSITDLFTGVYKPTASRVAALDVFAPLIIGQAWPYPSTILAIIISLVPLLAFALLIRRQPASLQLLILAITPAACLATITVLTNQPYFRARYVTAIIAPISILIAAAVWYLANSSRRIGLIPLGALFTVSLISTVSYHFNPEFAKAPDWRAIITLLDDNITASDIVIQNYPDPAFTYYYHSAADTILLPSAPNPDALAMTQVLTKQLRDHRYVWFLPTPNSAWDRNQVIATALQDQLPLLNEFWIRNTHILAYAPSTPTTADMTEPLVVQYNHILRTDGWRITPRTLVHQSAATISLELFYHPIQTTTQPLTFFVHLISTTNSQTSLIAQADHPPQNQPAFPGIWNQDTLLRDIFTLVIPTNTPDGEYTLVFGLYDPTTNERLPPHPTRDSPTPNSTIITTITINNNKKRDAP